MRTGKFISRGLSTLALIATVIATAVVPASATDLDEAAPGGIDVIVSQPTAPGERPEFEVVNTNLGGLITLLQDPNVDVELDGSAQLMWRPNDPDYLDQWEHHTTGMETAWDTTRGSSDIVIAVIDSGVAAHPEFGDRLLNGESFIDGNVNVDPLGHGTAVATVAAGGANNSIGGVGSCPNCSILPVQVADNSGSVPWSAAASGVVWAVDNGADILNLSFGSKIESGVLADAIEYALSRDVIVIAAAGNYGTSDTVYPAALPGVISVAGHNGDLERYSWSSSGQWVDLAAPGCARALHNDAITTVCGTSFSAPWTSGAVGLMLTASGSLTPGQVETVLEAGSTPLDYVETGAVDASLVIGGGFADLHDFRARVSAREVDFTGDYRGDVVQVDLLVGGKVADSDGDLSSGTFDLMWDASDAGVGSYTVQVAAHDSDGGEALSRAVTLEVIEGTDFSDVQTNSFYEEAVEWMVAEEITSGTSPTTFAPEAPVTRGQLATFLWRFAGRPTPTAEPGFEDVNAWDFFAEPIAWMVEQEITLGTGPTTFSPNATVTRGQLAAFLYRYAGKPNVDTEASFSDVNPWDYYATPVAFMVELAVTTGTSPTTFSPDAPVTRAQLATFLWRYAGKPVV